MARPIGTAFLVVGVLAAVFGLVGMYDVLAADAPGGKTTVAAPLALVLACILLGRGSRMMRSSS